MAKGNHVYTLNHDLKALQQKQNEDNNIVVKASNNYKINEGNKVHEFKMIDSVDDLLKLSQAYELINQEKSSNNQTILL